MSICWKNQCYNLTLSPSFIQLSNIRQKRSQPVFPAKTFHWRMKGKRILRKAFPSSPSTSLSTRIPPSIPSFPWWEHHTFLASSHSTPSSCPPAPNPSLNFFHWLAPEFRHRSLSTPWDTFSVFPPRSLPSACFTLSLPSFLHSGLWKESNETHVLIPFHSFHHFSFLLPLLNTRNTHFLFSHTTLFFIRRRRILFLPQLKH